MGGRGGGRWRSAGGVRGKGGNEERGAGLLDSLSPDCLYYSRGAICCVL